MVVVCLYNQDDGRVIPFTIGKHYNVDDIVTNVVGKVLFRMVNDNGTMANYESIFFRTLTAYRNEKLNELGI